MSPGWLAFCAMTLFSIWQADKWTQAEKRIAKQDRDIIDLTERVRGHRRTIGEFEALHIKLSSHGQKEPLTDRERYLIQWLHGGAE